MLTTTTRESRPRDRMVIESRAAEITPGDRTDRQATLLVYGIGSAGAIAALAYVYLRRPDNGFLIVPAAIVSLVYAVVKGVTELRTATKDRARKLSDAAEVAAGKIMVIHCESTELVKIEGDASGVEPVYAFQAEPDQILLVTGDLFENARGFPSTAFEITVAEEDEDEVLSVSVMGEPLNPIRTIPFSSFDGTPTSNGQLLIDGQLEDLENLLA